MAPSSSRSPRRRQVRRYLSATGTRWTGRAPSSSSTSKRRRGSFSSTNRITPSHTPSELSDDDEGFDDTASVVSHPETFNLLQAVQDNRQTLAYSSLPATPISSSPRPETPPPRLPQAPFPSDPEPPSRHDDAADTTPFSLWDYLREELLATDFDSHQELKWERVSNFLSMPVAIEKIMLFGFVVCLDSFLYTFTILPIRFALASARLLLNTFRPSAPPLPPSQKADILRALLLVISIIILSPLTDASMIYHSIRGQDTIKLYVIFNALEIADRLCGSIGQDIIDCLFSRSTLEVISHRKRPTSDTLRPFFYFFLALIYTVSHTLVMIYQMISLNVAVNSYDHALLTLLVSNQFVEIKGSVFKKFEKDNLFQITCADIVERFTLALMLLVVAFRNLIELSGSSFNFSEGFALPKSFGWFRGDNVLWTISYPVLTVMISETLVDWLKHAFITKFNHIRPSVYERYTDVLCRDLASASGVSRRGARKHTYVDQSPLVARRLGFASLPLAVLAILIGSQSLSLLVSMHTDDASPVSTLSALLSTPFAAPLASLSALLRAPRDSASVLAAVLRALSPQDVANVAKGAALAALFWVASVVIKLILGVNLLSYATHRRAEMGARERADRVNDFGRDPIGEGKEEQKYNRELKTLLDNRRDDAAEVAEIGESKPVADGGGKGGGGGGGGKKRLPLEDITRYTMVKRIW